MTSKTQKTPINLFIKQSEIDDKVLTKNDSSTAYIILQNNVLQTKHAHLVSSYNQLKSEKEGVDDDCEKLEKAKTCLQGLVKNENSRADNYKKLFGNSELGISRMIKLFFTCNIISVLYFFVPFVPFDTNQYYRLSLALTIMVIHATVICKGAMQLYVIFFNNEEVKTAKYENDEIEKSNKYLDELIDNF